MDFLYIMDGKDTVGLIKKKLKLYIKNSNKKYLENNR